MVLHLLGKKSWNVYNSENVERVRKDEAEAKAREDAEEQRLQQEDAVRRIAILRGETPPPPPSLEPPAKSEEQKPRRDDGSARKRRRLRGEDDTDRDIRYAREDAETNQKARQALVKGAANDDAPLHDHAGNIQLIPAPDEKSIRKAEKNAEAEAEKAKKRKRDEDQYTMRFSNAAGFQNGMEKPWYASSTSASAAYKVGPLVHLQEKDVWGNEDPSRKERERNRISGNDPFAVMQQAQKQLKQSDVDKQKWRREREAETEELRRSEERKQRPNGKYRLREKAEDSLEGFSLDGATRERRERSDHDRHRRRHYRHSRRSRSRERHRHNPKRE